MNITAKVIRDSVSEQGIRLTTMLVDYPRIVHAEQLKHRMFSTSAASSRAIPFAKMQEQLTGKPTRFGSAQAGMQDGGQLDKPIKFTDGYGTINCESASDFWDYAAGVASDISGAFKDAGFHKQIYNRITEPFQTMRVLITATEWDNFWWLRNDVAADPTLHETARIMKEAYDASKPQILKAGEYHLPFVDQIRDKKGMQSFYIRAEQPKTENSVGIATPLTLEEAITVSCARCAAQSFRNTDYGLKKSEQVYDRLVNDDKVHAGALEHVATPMKVAESDYRGLGLINVPSYPKSWQDGVSHADRDGQLWSGNLRGWVQHRKTVVGENYIG
jgi:hypothetical protein